MDAAGQQSQARKALSDLEARLGPQLEVVRDRLEELNARALETLRAYPGTCLLCAVGVGFLIGRLASRR